MNEKKMTEHKVVDTHFGELSFIPQHDTLMKTIADEYFGRSVEINVFSVSCLDNNFECKGFIHIDELRIPFRYIQDSKTSKGYSMDISLYYTVVYSRDEKFNDDDYHHINSPVKNVLRTQVDDYTQKLIATLPTQHSIDLSGVLKSLYFYPYIDSKNGKSLKIVIDLTRNNMCYFINHYQSTSTIFHANMSFYYDGDSFSFNCPNFTMINVNNLDFQDYWKYLISSHFLKPSLTDFINNTYQSINEILLDLNKALLVLEMDQI